MIKAKGYYRDRRVELDKPLDLAEGTQVDVEIRPAEEVRQDEAAAWAEVGMSRLEEEWDNPQDAIYDDWKKLYGV